MSTKSEQGRKTANILQDEVPCVDLVKIYIEEKARIIHRGTFACDGGRGLRIPVM